MRRLCVVKLSLENVFLLNSNRLNRFWFSSIPKVRQSFLLPYLNISPLSIAPKHYDVVVSRAKH